MLCKVTSKNQITIPKEIMRQMGSREYFDARIEEGHIVLEPMVIRPTIGPKLAALRTKLRDEGLLESDVPRLVDEARRAGGA